MRAEEFHISVCSSLSGSSMNICCLENCVILYLFFFFWLLFVYFCYSFFTRFVCSIEVRVWVLVGLFPFYLIERDVKDSV